jgi:hypothetical protein
MNRVVHYLPCSVVCHGECELILVQQIQVKKRRFLNPLSKDKGRQSILINTINHYLNSLFPDKKAYIKKNRDLLQVDKDKNFIKHKIFTIMDKDEASDELFESYKNKSLFKEYWWGKEDLIVPIYFDPNMDAVFNNHGIVIDTNKQKPAQYFKHLTTQYDKIIEMLRSLSGKESNIKEMFDYLDSIKNNEYKK